MLKRKIIAIVGPTASGKTGIGVRLAKEFNGEILSADSRQVYRGLDLGTGKEGRPAQSAEISNLKSRILNQNPNTESPSDQVDEKLRPFLCYIDGVPQWMIDIAEPEEKMTLFDYLPLARLAIEDIFSRGKVPIIVGGTGLYIQGLVEGFELSLKNVISNESEKSHEISCLERSMARNDSVEYDRGELNSLTIGQLNNLLQQIDPDKYERVDHKNRHRLIRAIELAQEGLVPTKVKPDFEVLQIAIDLPRQELHDRIDRRVEERFAAGMLEETERLLAAGVSPDWLINLGLEYREMTTYILKMAELLHCSIADLPDEFANNEARKQYDDEFNMMRQQLKWRIHQFARRQLTWFRRFPEVNWLSDFDEIKRFAKIFLEH